MKKTNKKWDKEKKDFETRMNHYRVEDSRKFIDRIDNDPEKEKRIDLQNCKVCHYESGRMAFQAFTDVNCGFCNVDMTFVSSLTDELCKRCAIMNEACKHCGGEMD